MESSSSLPSEIDSQTELLGPPINSSSYNPNDISAPEQGINANELTEQMKDNMDYCEMPSENNSTVVTVPPFAYYYAEPGTTENINMYYGPNIMMEPSKIDYYPPHQQQPVETYTIPIQQTVTVAVQVKESNDHRLMFHIGLAFAILSWILQIVHITVFALICIVAAQVILWSNYNSHRNSIDEVKRRYAQKSHKMAIAHLIVSGVVMLIGVLLAALSTAAIIVIYIVFYVVAISLGTTTSTR